VVLGVIQQYNIYTKTATFLLKNRKWRKCTKNYASHRTSDLVQLYNTNKLNNKGLVLQALLLIFENNACNYMIIYIE
ncbi:MAG: hypothetical protein PHG16_04715, partial [Lachnospiraceae bacterium]|nr:hypothetical protein [Lachnospiraceae bacterium]